MSEHTKGKLEAIYNTIYRKQTYIGGCVGYFEKTVLSNDVNEANAKELVRRWNAFEDGGLVEELRTACKKVLQYKKAAEEGRLNKDENAHEYWESVMSYVEAALTKS